MSFILFLVIRKYASSFLFYLNSEMNISLDFYTIVVRIYVKRNSVREKACYRQ